MSALVSEPGALEKIVDPTKQQPKDCGGSTKNGLINGLIHKMSQKTQEDGLQELQATANVQQNHVELSADDVNSVGKLKKKAKKKKHKTQLDSNENVNEPKLDEIDCITETLDELGSCSSKTYNSNSETSNCDAISSDIEKLVIKDDSNINATAHNDTNCHKEINFVPYESELQMPMIMKIIQKDLSEPYSIYTYRYFIHNWPKLCFLAMSDGQCVGAIVCKLDLHRKVVRRGYIAMLAVDQNYRKLRIGSTLVQMAIQEMTNGDADEVVLETEVTNKPALKLYEKLGFVRDKRLFRYYLNGVDALRLKLWLR